MTWEQLPAERDWQRLTDALKSASAVLCIAHVTPDGDALGSALAGALAMRQVGINAVVSFDEEPFAVPGSLSWLPGEDLLRAPTDLPARIDVAVSFDASAFERIGRLGPISREAGLFAAIDHHRSYTGFAELSIVDVTAPATAVLALELVDRLGAELTSDIATCVYAGLTTDTGSFRFAGTTAATHEIAARLHRAGIAHDEIARAVFDNRPFTAVLLMGQAVARAELDPTAAGGLGMVSTQITCLEREGLGLPLDAAESIIDVIRTAAEAEIAVVFKEGDDAVWRVSTRSKGAIDMGAVCSSLGGGGHRFAAGFSAEQDPDQILPELLAAIDAELASPH